MGERALCLLERHLERPRIDLEQEVALLDQLALGKTDLLQLAVDLRLDGDGRERGHGAETGHDHVDVAGRDGRHADRLRGGAATAARGCGCGRRGNARSPSRTGRARSGRPAGPASGLRRLVVRRRSGLGRSSTFWLMRAALPFIMQTASGKRSGQQDAALRRQGGERMSSRQVCARTCCRRKRCFGERRVAACFRPFQEAIRQPGSQGGAPGCGATLRLGAASRFPSAAWRRDPAGRCPGCGCRCARRA